MTAFVPETYTTGEDYPASRQTEVEAALASAISTASAALTASGSAAAGVPGAVPLSSFTGSTPEAKLTAAMTALTGQSPRHSTLLIDSEGPFATTRTAYQGQHFMGAAGIGPHNMEIAGGNGLLVPQMITLNVGNGLSSWMSNTTTLNSVSFKEFAFKAGNSTAQFWNSSGGNGFYPARFMDCSFYGFYGVFGNLTTKALLTQVTTGGHMTILGSTSTPIHIGGSDNKFRAFLNIQGNGKSVNGVSSGVAGAGRFLEWYDGVQKTGVSDHYDTCVNGWRGIRVSGSLSSSSGLVFNNMEIEGAGAAGSDPGPNVGCAVLIDGSSVTTGPGTTWRDIWIKECMTGTTVSGTANNTYPVTNAQTSISERGIFHITGGVTVIDGIRYAPGTNTGTVTGSTPFGYTGTTGTAVPLVYCSAGTVTITNAHSTNGVKPFAIQNQSGGNTGVVTSPDSSCNILTV